MFRLATALCVAYLLLPADAVIRSDIPTEANSIEVSTVDALSAAQSVYSDLSQFCERNAETCETGKSVATLVVATVKAGIAEFSDTNSGPQKTSVDQTTVTGSIN